MSGGLNLFSGFVQGFAGAKARRRQEEREAEERKERMAQIKANTQLIKARQDALKYKQVTEERQATERQNLLEMLGIKIPSGMGEARKPQTSEGTELGSGFTGQDGGVANQMAISQMSPAALAILKELTGYDLLSAGRLTESRERGDVLARQGDERIAESKRKGDIAQSQLELSKWKAETEYKTTPVKLEGGGEGVLVLPKFGMQTGQQIQTRPAARKIPIPPGQIQNYMNMMGENPPFNMSPEQAEKQGFKKLSPGQIDSVRTFGTVDSTLVQIERMMESVFPKEETFGQYVLGAAQRAGGAMLQTNIPAANLKKFVDGTLAPVIRTLGEKGTLSDTDVKRAKKLMADMTDRGQVAWNALKNMRVMIGNAKLARLGFRFKDKEQVKQSYRNGFLHKDHAQWLLVNQFGMEQ
jgi:hypothetical protein